MSYLVVFSREAEEDLERLFEHAFERELNNPTGVLDVPMRAIEAIRQACQFLTASPFTRELIVHFGASGCVVLYEIKASSRVHIGAIRHQRESDYP